MKNLYIFLFLFILYSCGINKATKICIGRDNKKSKKEIFTKIDSVIKKDTFNKRPDELKRILNYKCNDDNILEIEVITKCKFEKIVYFDENLNILQVLNIIPIKPIMSHDRFSKKAHRQNTK